MSSLELLNKHFMKKEVRAALKQILYLILKDQYSGARTDTIMLLEHLKTLEDKKDV